jgi:hypothetical protein
MTDENAVNNGGYRVWTSIYYEPEFFTSFASGTAPGLNTQTGSLKWVEEPR